MVEGGGGEDWRKGKGGEEKLRNDVTADREKSKAITTADKDSVLR